MTHPAMFAGLLVIMTAYLALVVHLMGYLRRVHPQTWVALGRPAIPKTAEHMRDPSIFVRSGFLTLLFIFSGQHKLLRDDHLTRLIWSLRMLLAAAVVLLPATALLPAS